MKHSPEGGQRFHDKAWPRMPGEETSIGGAFRDPGGRKCPDQGCANWGRQEATDMMHRRRPRRAGTSSADPSALSDLNTTSRSRTDGKGPSVLTVTQSDRHHLLQ